MSSIIKTLFMSITSVFYFIFCYPKIKGYWPFNDVMMSQIGEIVGYKKPRLEN